VTVSRVGGVGMPNKEKSEVDITDFVKSQMATNSDEVVLLVQSDVSMFISPADISLKVTTAKAPQITPSEDYTGVACDTAKTFNFNIDGFGSPLTVTANVDNVSQALTQVGNDYSFTRTFTEGVYPLEITAVNSLGMETVYSININAYAYQISNKTITVEKVNGVDTATGSALISSNTLDKAIVIIGFYNEDNRMLDANISTETSLTGISRTATVSKAIPEGIVSIRLFVWYDTTTVKPLTDFEEISYAVSE